MPYCQNGNQHSTNELEQIQDILASTKLKEDMH